MAHPPTTGGADRPRADKRRPASLPAAAITRISALPPAIAFTLVLLVVAVSVALATRALRANWAAERSLDATRAGVQVAAVMRSHVEALRGLQTVFVTRAPTVERIDRTADALEPALRRFSTVWVVDSGGTILRSFTYDSAGRRSIGRGGRVDLAGSPELRRLDSLVRGGARAVLWLDPRIDRQLPSGGAGEAAAGTTPPDTSLRRDHMLLIEPAVLDGVVVGYVGGAVGRRDLRRALQLDAHEDRRGAVVLAGVADTAARSTDFPPGPVHPRDLALVHVDFGPTIVPLDGRWRVLVAHRDHATTLALLWVGTGLGVLGVGALLVYARRNVRRLADRSDELERLSAELLRANRTKSEFLANVSHELRTPLNAIVGFTELLREGVYGELTARQLGPVERIEGSAGHLRQLVDQVLDLAKMAAGRLEVHPELITLRPFVFGVAAEIEPLLTEHGLSLSLAVPATLPRVRTDPTHLRQILLNLLGNAVKFTPAGSIAVRGRLVLVGAAGAPDPTALAAARADRSAGESDHGTAPAPAAWVALQVVDTGVGIDPRDQQRIFEEFEQVNPGARGDSARRGTGLGLPLSRRLAALLGGTLTVESAAGAGAAFTLWLPVEAPEMRDGGGARSDGRGAVARELPREPHPAPHPS